MKPFTTNANLALEEIEGLSAAALTCSEAIKGFTESVKLIQFDPIGDVYIEASTLRGDTSGVFTPDREYGWYRKFEKTDKRGRN